MSDENLIFIAITVFILMIVGLVLTALEFRSGAPHRQEQEHKQNPQSSPQRQGM
jgi:flagellar basal body-associated protein FliL